MFGVCTSNCWWKVQTTKWHLPHLQKSAISDCAFHHHQLPWLEHRNSSSHIRLMVFAFDVGQSNYVINKIKAMYSAWKKEKSFSEDQRVNSMQSKLIEKLFCLFLSCCAFYLTISSWFVNLISTVCENCRKYFMVSHQRLLQWSFT